MVEGPVYTSASLQEGPSNQVEIIPQSLESPFSVFGCIDNEPLFILHFRYYLGNQVLDLLCPY